MSTNRLASTQVTASDSVRAARCQYAFPGTCGHECGDPATSVLVTVRPEDVRQALLGLGVIPSSDGLSRAGRCNKHRDVREYGDGRFVRSEAA